MIDREMLREMFDSIAAKGQWDMSQPMLWGYFFTIAIQNDSMKSCLYFKAATTSLWKSSRQKGTTRPKRIYGGCMFDASRCTRSIPYLLGTNSLAISPSSTALTHMMAWT